MAKITLAGNSINRKVIYLQLVQSLPIFISKNGFI